MLQIKTQLMGILLFVAVLADGTTVAQEFVQPGYRSYYGSVGQTYQSFGSAYPNPNVIYGVPQNYSVPQNYNVAPGYFPSANYTQPSYAPAISAVVPEYLESSVVVPITNSIDAIGQTVPPAPIQASDIAPKDTPQPSEAKLPLEDQIAPKQLSESSSLSDLIRLEKKVQEILTRVFPAVVSIDGGSGVIVRSDGVILTASHVTKKANRLVNVRLSDGRIAVARTLGTNTNTDTAALKLLSSGPWPFVSLESGKARLGDWCIALGYPLSFKRGENAAVRIGRILKKTDSRITTDCAIMGGDSGGPLINMNGNVIAISSRVKPSLNENFHVPVINYLNEWEQLAASIDVRSPLLKKKNTRRSYLGILGETDIDRVRIRSVIDGSPAQMAGMMKKDVILELDGKPVSKFDEILAMLETRKPGETVLAKLNRFGTLLDVSISLGERDEAND